MTITVAKLIEVLQQVEDKSIQVCFTYDGRCGAEGITCVDYAPDEMRAGPAIVFREEFSEEYESYKTKYSKNDVNLYLENASDDYYFEMDSE